MRISLMLCAALLAGAPRVSAYAQDASEEPASVAKARFLDGRAAYEAGDFEGARDCFAEAYAADRRPALLYNLGLAEQKLGHVDAALAAFEGYLGGSDGARDEEVAGRIAALRDIAAQRPAPAAAADPEPRANVDDADLAIHAAPPPAAVERAAEPARDATTSEARPSLRRRRWLIATAVLIVAAGAAAGIAIPLAHKHDEQTPPQSGLTFHAWRAQ